MHKKLRNWLILTFFIGFIFVSFKMTELSANYPIVSDLTLTSEQQTGTLGDKITITITAANSLDTKVRLPLPANVVMTAAGNEGGTVTYDQTQNQLIIDWENAEIENRFMTIELEILEPGGYSFQASVTREEDTVLSNSLTFEITEPEKQEEVEIAEPPEQTEDFQSPDVSNIGEGESISEEPVIDRLEKISDPRIGLPINEVFPDPKLADTIAKKLFKNVTDPLTEKDVMGVFDLTLYGIGDLTGIDIFYNLGTLSVSQSTVKNIPDSISNLKNLFQLVIDNTPIETLPDALKEMPKLKGIALNYTAMTDFPKILTEMPQLIGINFSYHNLYGKKLPDEIGQLKNLTSLTLMQTGISELPGTVSNLTELTDIDLRDNKLTKFPEQLLTLIHLKKINLNNNTIPTLPEGIGNLTKLTELQMNNGGLMMLPDSIGNLTNLTNLSFAGNNLMTLPESLKNLTQLTSIDLTNNILPTTIDQKLKDTLPNLSWTGGLQTKFTLTSELVFDNVRYFDDIQMSRILAVSRLFSQNPGNTNNFIKNSKYDIELEGFTNQNGKPIALETYIEDGVVIKSGTIYAKVRISSKEKPINELFPTAKNDNNLADQTVQLNLVAPALTFISAPTELSFGGDLTISTKKQVYPLISLNDALSVQDNRKEKTNWRMTAKMTKELTASNEQQLTNSIHYRLNGIDSILNTFDIVIYQQKNSNDQPFNISDSWNQTTNGLFLEIEPGQAFSETYSGVIEWKLQDVPSG